MTRALEYAVKIRSYPGAPKGGDLGLVATRPDGALVALIDASGHGLASHAVALTARRIIGAHAGEALDAIFARLEDALRGTLGAAISIARLTGDGLEFAGVGNVAIYVDMRPLHVHLGVVGQRRRPPPVALADLPADAWLLMHTDGVRRPDAVPRGCAETAAAALILSHGQLHDDAGVLLLRWREAPA